MALNYKAFSKEGVHMVYKINNEIITNIDIKKESAYLVALNNQLKNLGKDKILEISKESVLREQIKKGELLKYFDLSKNTSDIDFYIKNFYSKLKLNNEDEFQKYLKSYNLTLKFVKKKIQVEAAWNQLIYDKYKDQINIDEEKLKNEIIKNSSTINKKLYSLSEIIFEINNQENFDQTNKKIIESINEIGFKNTANIYSIADSSKFGGNIGWIEEEKLSKKILIQLAKLNIGEFTLPMQIGGSFLILKVEELKYEKKTIDENQELNKKIQFETSRQLDQFSKIYYNKIKINTSINEL